MWRMRMTEPVSAVETSIKKDLRWPVGLWVLSSNFHVQKCSLWSRLPECKHLKKGSTAEWKQCLAKLTAKKKKKKVTNFRQRNLLGPSPLVSFSSPKYNSICNLDFLEFITYSWIDYVNWLRHGEQLGHGLQKEPHEKNWVRDWSWEFRVMLDVQKARSWASCREGA